MTAVDATWLPVAWPAASALRLYGDVAWTLVVAAAVCHAVPRRWIGFGPRAILVVAGLVALVGAVLLAVGRGAGAQALGLALQQPSGLLTGLAVVALWRRAAVVDPGARASTLAAPTWPLAWAWLWGVAGTLLYADTLGLLSLGWYPLGLPTQGHASWAALALAGATLAAWRMPAWRPAVVALAIALALHATLRLPTGNLWDALLDPVLWVWAVGCTASAGVRVLRRRGIRQTA